MYPFSRLLPLLALVSSSPLLAQEYPIEIFEYVDDIKVVAFINNSDIDKTVQWTPFEETPPLTINDALEDIKTYIAKIPEFNNSTLSSIELKQVPGHRNYWHYLVRIESLTGNNLHPHYFVVLMNGKIIPAVREPEAFK